MHSSDQLLQIVILLAAAVMIVGIFRVIRLSPVLGYLVADNRSMEGEVADFSYRLPDYRGNTGVERDYDQELRGKAGVTQRAARAAGLVENGDVIVVRHELGVRKARGARADHADALAAGQGIRV